MSFTARLLNVSLYLHATILVACFCPAQSLGRSLVRLLARQCF
jgi:hypothetical protein